MAAGLPWQYHRIYSWLEEGRLGASAILLDSNIDTGAVVARRRHPLPAEGVDPDYVWDASIGADLLVRVLRHRALYGKLPDPEPQNVEIGRTFYVVHPLLKYVAILTRGGDRGA